MTTKVILGLALLSIVVLAQVPQPFDFNWADLKDIWESPRLQPALQNITKRYSRSGDLNGPRIVGGDVARPGQFPFALFAVIDNTYVCGGSLINSYWVLTAGHCIYQSYQVVVYSTVDRNEGYYWSATSAELILHEHYDDLQIVNDIALIRLPSPAPDDYYTSYISLPYGQTGNSFAGYTATIQGFGVYSDALGSVSNVKRYVQQYILTNANCAIWGPFPTELCTETTGGRGPCNGDSGGGLFIGDSTNHNADRYLVGLVSFGSSAGCELGYPVVFTRVTEFLPWIESHSSS